MVRQAGVELFPGGGDREESGAVGFAGVEFLKIVQGRGWQCVVQHVTCDGIDDNSFAERHWPECGIDDAGDTDVTSCGESGCADDGEDGSKDEVQWDRSTSSKKSSCDDGTPNKQLFVGNCPVKERVGDSGEGGGSKPVLEFDKNGVKDPDGNRGFADASGVTGILIVDNGSHPGRVLGIAGNREGRSRRRDDRRCWRADCLNGTPKKIASRCTTRFPLARHAASYGRAGAAADDAGIGSRLRSVAHSIWQDSRGAVSYEVCRKKVPEQTDEFGRNG